VLVGIIAGAAALLVAAALELTVFDVFGIFDADKPLTAAELLDLGEKYLLELDYEQAIVQFSKLIEIEPKNARAYTALAETYTALGQTDEVIAILEQGLTQLPDNADILAMLDELRPPEPTPTPTPSPPPTPTVTPNATPTVPPNVTPIPTPTTVPADGQMASGTIEIVDVTPKTAVPGVETAFSVTVRYTSANIGGCVIYAGANTSESQRYALYDEYILPDISGTYTFSFICTPAAWTDNAFGIYVNMSEYPHPDSWTPLDMDVYDLAAPPTPTPTPTAPPVTDYITIKGEQYSTSLTGLDLSRLDLTDADIEPLRYMTNLTRLELANNQISNVSPLKGLTNLTYLGLGNNQISDISPLKGLTNLMGLSLSGNQISDISPLKGLTNLTGLVLGNNQISDVSPLKGLTYLVDLLLGNNQISDISPFKDMTNLRYLRLDSNQISDISPLGGLTNLTKLNLSSNQISDVNPLKGLTNLTHLYLSDNQISDVSPFKELTNLTYLVLNDNPITDWSPVAHVEDVWGRP
jgi:hypothetical protein